MVSSFEVFFSVSKSLKALVVFSSTFSNILSQKAAARETKTRKHFFKERNCI